MVLFSRANALAAAGALLLLGAASAPVFAGDPTTNFGPVGPNDPILATIGGQRLIAFFLPERGSCAVNAVIWKDAGVDAPYASSRIKVSLRPGEMVEFDHGGRESHEPAVRRRRLDPCRGGTGRTDPDRHDRKELAGERLALSGETSIAAPSLRGGRFFLTRRCAESRALPSFFFACFRVELGVPNLFAIGG